MMRLEKRPFAVALAAMIALGPVSGVLSPAWAADKTLQGSVIHMDEKQNNPSINPDDIREVVPGTQIDMVLTTPVDTAVNAEGNEFFAKVARDYMVDGKVVIPHGTLVHGSVTQMEGPKRAGRKAWIQTKFDYMITPDGREIPIEGNYTTRDNGLKAGAKVVGKAVGKTLIGGAIGALVTVKYGGLPLIAATEGWSLAGGAAIGGAAGLTYAMIKKGKSAMIPVDAEISVRLAEPLALPTMNMPDEAADNFTLEGLNVKILGMQLTQDPWGEANEINLTLDVSNYTENTFSTFDIAIEDEYGKTFFASPFGDTGMWFRKLTPNTKLVSNLTFNVDNPRRGMKLVFYKQYTREPLAKFALSQGMMMDKKAMKQVQKTNKKRLVTEESTMMAEY